MAAKEWFLSMNSDHSFWLTYWPPVVAKIYGTNVRAFYQQIMQIDGELTGDKGRQQICSAFVRDLWPEAFDILRPLQYVKVPMSGGKPIGEKVKL